MTVYFEADGVTLHLGDCLKVMAGMEADSVDLLVIDPPYSGVKDAAWDNQWASAAEYLQWLDAVLEQFARLLRFNGSQYLFASPQMAARVEVLVGERFNVLNTITWRKPPFSTKAEMFDKSTMRAYFPASERVIFAEHYNSDNHAKGEAGYAAECDKLRGFVFEPLRAYLADELKRAGLRPDDVNESLGFRRQGGMAGRHYFSQSQWQLPTKEHYEKMQALFNKGGGEFLRREYEFLRREYEDLRRPFFVTPEVPYTDVWDFHTVQSYKGKHPCEKPLAMLEHIISASSRPGAIVMDCFMGSGSTGEAARRLGRQFVGIEQDAHWCEYAAHRIANAKYQPRLFTPDGEPTAKQPHQAELFGDSLDNAENVV